MELKFNSQPLNERAAVQQVISETFDGRQSMRKIAKLRKAAEADYKMLDADKAGTEETKL